MLPMFFMAIVIGQDIVVAHLVLLGIGYTPECITNWCRWWWWWCRHSTLRQQTFSKPIWQVRLSAWTRASPLQALDIDATMQQYTASQEALADKQVDGDDEVLLSQDSTTDELRAEIRAAMKKCECFSSCFEKLSLSDIYNHVLQLWELGKGKKEMYLEGLLDSTHWNQRTTEPDRKWRRYRYTALAHGKYQHAAEACTDHGADQASGDLHHQLCRWTWVTDAGRPTGQSRHFPNTASCQSHTSIPCKTCTRPPRSRNNWYSWSNIHLVHNT